MAHMAPDEEVMNTTCDKVILGVKRMSIEFGRNSRTHRHSLLSDSACGNSEEPGEPRAGGSGGGSGWRSVCSAREGWQVAGAEAAGTALLVLLSCLPACSDTPPVQRALAAGFVVALLVQCLDHVSGAMFNPTVTLAALIARRIGRRRALAMLGAQLAGAAGGAALLHLLAAPHAPPAASLCVTRPAPGLSPYKAVALEAVLGGCLALANCASWDARNRGLLDSWPLRIGTAVAGLSLAAGDLTGASMNPVRSFGPALLSGDWTAHWVYWAGPLSGSVVCTALYNAAWRAPATAEPRARLPPPPAPPAHPAPAACPHPAGGAAVVQLRAPHWKHCSV